jgi:ribosomal protein S18 acetylase RimI-like enzyme
VAIVREYDPQRDAQAVRACFVELQEAEREFEPELPLGEEAADAYLKLMFAGCEKWAGQVFVAEVENGVIGFVCVYARMRIDEPDEAPKEFASVSDVAVLTPYRGRGLGRALLSRAEQYARERGATTLRLLVLSQNTVAKQLYIASGFRERFIQMTKKLIL